jgi:hypothetical protein
MPCSRAIAVGVLLVTTAGVSAQQPPAQVQLGVLRVPACQQATDPEYGRVAMKAIAIGGGPGYMQRGATVHRPIRCCPSGPNRRD